MYFVLVVNICSHGTMSTARLPSSSLEIYRRTQRCGSTLTTTLVLLLKLFSHGVKSGDPSCSARGTRRGPLGTAARREMAGPTMHSLVKGILNTDP